MVNPISFDVGIALLSSSCLFSWWKGGRAERLGAMMIFGANISADVVDILSNPHFPFFAIFMLDLALAVGLLFLAVRYSSMWLGVAMLLQSMALASYAMQSVDQGLSGPAYKIFVNSLTVMMLACIVGGSISSWRKRIRSRRASGFATPASSSAPTLV